jgi:hypothetical protein
MMQFEPMRRLRSSEPKETARFGRITSVADNATNHKIVSQQAIEHQIRS